jgi:hypothetical protein
MTDLFHPAMLERLADFFPSTVTIQYPVETQDPLSGELSVVWTDLPDHIGLGCSLAPSSGREVRQPDHTYVIADYTIALPGSYPSITEKMRAVVNGTAYDILLVQGDSHAETTRLSVRTVT